MNPNPEWANKLFTPSQCPEGGRFRNSHRHLYEHRTRPGAGNAAGKRSRVRRSRVGRAARAASAPATGAPARASANAARPAPAAAPPTRAAKRRSGPASGFPLRLLHDTISDFVGFLSTSPLPACSGKRN